MKRLVLLAAILASPAAAEPLAIYNGRLFIPAKVNGSPTEALLDSGAEATLLDKGFAASIRLPAGERVKLKGSGGEQEAEVVGGVMIEALGQRMEKLDAVVLDLSDLSTRLTKHPTPAIVGRELFDAARIRIDMAGLDVRAVSRDATPAGRKLALTRRHGIEAMPVTIAGVSALADLDFGNGTAVLVSRVMADRLKLKPTGKVQGGGIGGSITRQTAVLPTLTVAGRTFRNVPVQIDPLPNAGEVNIGTSILRHFIVTTDFKARAVWLAPARKARS